MDLADAERKTRSTYDLCSVEHTSLSQIFLHFLTFFFLFCFGKRFWSRTCGLDPCLLYSRVLQCAFQPFFFFFLQPQRLTFQPWTVHSYTVHGSQISLFNKFFIKNKSHDTIHTFKNYFTTVFSVFNFSVFSFQFQQNKLYPNSTMSI